MVKLIWTESARYDLQDIHDYIALDSKKYASLTIRKLFSLAQEIPKNPMLGRLVPEFGNSEIRERILGNYRIVYKLKSTEQIDVFNNWF